MSDAATPAPERGTDPVSYPFPPPGAETTAARPANARRISLPPDRLAPLRAISALTLREMSSTYGRSPGGYLWAVIEPIGGIAVMALVFALIMRSPPIGNSFVLFFATGFLPFDLFLSSQQKTQSALRANRALLSYPRVTWLDAIIARLTLNTLTEITVLVIIIGSILAFTGAQASLKLPLALHGLILTILGGAGVGLINGLLIGLFPIWGLLWGIFTRPLLIGSGVLVMYETLPRIVQDILWWNPLLHAISLFRAGFFSTYHPDFVSLPYCYGVALGLLALGLVCTRAWYKTVLEQ